MGETVEQTKVAIFGGEAGCPAGGGLGTSAVWPT
jgi:hypothetical protein